MTDVIINKIQSIQRCTLRAREEYNANPATFATDFSRQDAAILNVLRACEQAIDLANHIIGTYHLGIPNSSAESFSLLATQQIIATPLAEKLKKMAHFRNTIIHQYKETDLAIVRAVIENGLDDLISFSDTIMKWVKK